MVIAIFLQRSPICSLLVCTLNLIEYSPTVLLHFAFTLPLISQVRNFISLFSLSPFFFLFLFFLYSPSLNLGGYSLLTLNSFLPYRLIIVFLYLDISYSLFTFLQYSYSHSTFIKLHSAVVPIDPAVVFSAILILLVQYISILLQIS